MIALSLLWLPILVSAVFVFIASTVLWMTPFWHGKDYATFEDDSGVIGALSKAPSGQYLVPKAMMSKDKGECADAMSGPTALIMMRNPASSFSFPVALVSYFVYTLVVSVLVAYIAAVTLPAGTHYLKVFRVVGTAGILAYSFSSVAESVWYGKPWAITVRTIIDGVIYGLLMAGVFGWLWPR